VVVAGLASSSYAEPDEPTMVLTCSYTYSSDQNNWVSNVKFKVNRADETAVSDSGITFVANVNDAIIKLTKHSFNNSALININRLTGKLDGFWMINENEYAMSGECKSRSGAVSGGVISSKRRYVSE
jgi:hypothetical protein